MPRETRSGRYVTFGYWLDSFLRLSRPSYRADTLTVSLKLSNKRRVVVQKFSGKMFVNVREYYEDKTGEMKPGKKVSLKVIETVKISWEA